MPLAVYTQLNLQCRTKCSMKDMLVKTFLVFLIAWILPGALCQPCGKACKEAQRTALENIYEALDGPYWRSQEGWLTEAHHCSWEGVSCCEGGVEHENVTHCHELATVVALSLYSNNASGTPPVNALEQLAPWLVFLDLRNNRLSGPLPEVLSKATHLKWLLVDNNRFSGTLPESYSSLSNLTALSVSDNLLTGTLPVSYTKLSHLRSIELDRNCLTEEFPVEFFTLDEIEVISADNCCFTSISEPKPGSFLTITNSTHLLDNVLDQRSISQISFYNNSLSGSVAGFLMRVPVLSLTLAYNGLTGTLPDWRNNMVLSEINLRDNELHGTLPELFINGNMRLVDLSMNQISGTLPDLLGDADRLEVLNLSHNRLTGTLPASYDVLAMAQVVELKRNNFSRGHRLPYWIEVDTSPDADEEVHRDGAGNMLLVCKPLHTIVSEDNVVTLDPSYFSFHSCQCEVGFVADLEHDNNTLVNMTCMAPEVHYFDLRPILVPVLIAMFLMLVAGLLAYKYRLNQVVAQLRLGAEKKVPPGAERDVTLVLTDIQGSTELWEWNMELTAEGLQLHDRLMRELMAVFYGYEVSTEGDAFLVAFHEPFDAVAWCLATQLALHYAEWPEDLLNHRMTCEETAESCMERRKARQLQWEKMVADALNVQESGGQSAAALLPAALNASDMNDSIASGDEWQAKLTAANVQPQFDAPGGGAGVEDMYAAAGRFSLECEGGYGGLLGDARDAAGLLEWRQQVLFRGMRVRMSVATGYVDTVRVHSVTKRREYQGDVLKKVQAVGEAPHGGQILLDPETFNGVHNRLAELGGAVLEVVEKMSFAYFACKNVPLPVSEQTAPAHVTSSSSPWSRASTTTAAKKHHYADSVSMSSYPGHSSQQHQQQGALGTDHAGGFSWSYLMGKVKGSTAGSMLRSRHSDAGSSSLLAGDVEEGGIRALRRRRSSRSKCPGVWSAVKSIFRPVDVIAAPKRNSSMSYGVMVVDMGVHELDDLDDPVNITQVMPPGLEDRARFFPRVVSAQQKTPGYFDAPAAGAQPLSGPKLGPQDPLPEVIIVFCAFERYHDMLRLNWETAELAEQLYSDTVRWLLLAAGGYECQEGEGCFMAAFTAADAALEWSLMVQLVLRDLSWPANVLELPMCEEERDMHGNVVFRGPKVKMGIYAGVPTRVLPHTTTGRADYFGPLVNRAARYCHAAARGGQVLIAKDTMLKSVSTWVHGDADQLEPQPADASEVEVQECCVYFPAQRPRAWPWLFMRKNIPPAGRAMGEALGAGGAGAAAGAAVDGAGEAGTAAAGGGGGPTAGVEVGAAPEGTVQVAQMPHVVGFTTAAAATAAGAGPVAEGVESPKAPGAVPAAGAAGGNLSESAAVAGSTAPAHAPQTSGQPSVAASIGSVPPPAATAPAPPLAAGAEGFPPDDMLSDGSSSSLGRTGNRGSTSFTQWVEPPAGAAGGGGGLGAWQGMDDMGDGRCSSSGKLSPVPELPGAGVGIATAASNAAADDDARCALAQNSERWGVQRGVPEQQVCGSCECCGQPQGFQEQQQHSHELPAAHVVTKNDAEVQASDADTVQLERRLSRSSRGTGSGAFAAAMAAEGLKVDIRGGSGSRRERRLSWRSAASGIHPGLLEQQQAGAAAVQGRAHSGDSGWLAGGLAQELLLWQLEQQVDLSGGLHVGKRHRRESLCSYGPAASQPGVAAVIDDDLALLYGGGTVVDGDAAEGSGLLTMKAVSHHGDDDAGGGLGASGKLSKLSGVSGDALRMLTAPGEGAQGFQQQQQLQGRASLSKVPNGAHAALGSVATLPTSGAVAKSATSVPSFLGIGGGGPASVPVAPDPETLQSLRKAQSFGRGAAMSTHGTELSTAGFEGVSINQTCRAMMSSRWLWARQLLIHDLGTFKFKGVSGAHSIVSVSIEELAGRTFPTTIKKGKGEQLVVGRGLEYIVYLLPITRCKQLFDLEEQQ